MAPTGVASVHRNIAANFAGGGIAMAAFVVMVPIYLRLLGAEAYGLVGLFTTLAVAATALDLGLSHTLNREMARIDPDRGAGAVSDVAATLQACCWGVGALLGVLLVAAASPIATWWINADRLSAREVTVAFVLMGASLPAVVARAFYLAGLNGLQRQATVNAVQGAFTVVRAGLTIAALLAIAPTVTVFFGAQAVLLYAETAVLALAMWRAAPPAARGGRMRLAAVRTNVTFGAGVTATMVLGLALASVDQVVLSAILPLTEFGYYAIALAAAGALGQIVAPVTIAVYPRFSQLVARGDRTAIVAEYHFFSQLVAVLVLPLGAMLAFFPGEILTLWTGNGDVARHAAAILALRVVGTVLNTLLHVPHVVQLAFGWSSLGAWANAIALVVVAPATVLLSLQYGGVGAALAWIGLNAGSLLLAMRRMHGRVLPGELAQWYRSIALPAVAVTAVALAGRTAMPAALDAAPQAAWMAATGLAAGAAGMAAAGAVRGRVLDAAARMRASRG